MQVIDIGDVHITVAGALPGEKNIRTPPADMKARPDGSKRAWPRARPRLPRKQRVPSRSEPAASAWLSVVGPIRDPTMGQIEKLVPQPHEATALGFLIWKDWPIRSSTKSITEPPM